MRAKVPTVTGCLFLLLSVFLLLVPIAAMGDSSDYQADFTSYGTVVLQRKSGDTPTLHRSLQQMSYSRGWMMFTQDPFYMMVYLMLSTTSEQPSLNKAEFNQWLRTPGPDLQSTVSAAMPGVQEVAVDGTVTTAYTGDPDIDRFRTFFKRMNNDSRALEAIQDTSIETRERMLAWLKGAQAAATAHRATLESSYSFLTDTKLINAFLELEEKHLYEAQERAGLLYDGAMLLTNLSLLEAMITNERIGSNRMAYNMSLRPLLVHLNDTENAAPLGASNAAAVAYHSQARNQNECLVAGEPHQPSSFNEVGIGPNFRFFSYCMNVEHNGGKVPILGNNYMNTMNGVALGYSAEGANSGTANPAGGAYLFATPTNLTQYLDVNGSWRNFGTRTFQAIENGNTVTKTVYLVHDFGEVVAVFEDPATGIKYVLTQRQKPGSLAADKQHDAEKALVTGDAALYENALRHKGTYYWGEAGCGPTSSGDQKAFFFSHQGRFDKVRDEATIDSIYFNLIKEGYKKIGVNPGVGCYGQPGSSSDNGSVRDGNLSAHCQVNGYSLATMPKAWDPGGETPRQPWVLNFTQSVAMQQSLTDEEIVKFGTSTYSASVQRWAAVLAGSALQFPNLIPPANATEVNAFANAMAVYDGIYTGRSEELILFHLYKTLPGLPFSEPNTFPQVVLEYLLFKHDDVLAAVAAINQTMAQRLINLMVESTTFYLTKCIPNGYVTMKDTARIMFRGDEVVLPGTAAFGNPYGDARSTSGFKFWEENGETTCKLEHTGTSPFSHLYFDQEVYIRPNGTAVSPQNLIGGDALYVATANKWFEKYKKFNLADGYAKLDSFEQVCPFDTVYGPGEHPDTIHSLTVSVPSNLPTIPTPSPTPTPTGTPTPPDDPDCNNNNIPDSQELDSDGDGTINDCDECPNDPKKIISGKCGCGIEDADLNANGVLDCDTNEEVKAQLAAFLASLSEGKRVFIRGQSKKKRRKLIKTLTRDLKRIRQLAMPYVKTLDPDTQKQIKKRFKVILNLLKKSRRTDEIAERKSAYRKIVKFTKKLIVLF